MNRKIIILFSLTLVLISCQTPQITEEYDEFKKERICKLEPYIISFEFSLRSRRITYISLLKKTSFIIRATITTNILRNYKSLSIEPSLFFSLNHADGHIETFSFKGQDRTEMTQYEIQTTQYGTFQLPIQCCSVSFDIPMDKFQQMINAEEIRYVFEAGDEPIKGKLDEQTQQALRTFSTKCLSKQ